jgi:hypothetical protein
MNSLNFKKHNLAIPLSVIAGVPFILLAWWMIPLDLTVGSLDPSILQVLALAFVVWLFLLTITMAIIGKLLSMMVLQIKHFFEPTKQLTSWEQHVLYLALFALLVLSGTGCLIAVL